MKEARDAKCKHAERVPWQIVVQTSSSDACCQEVYIYKLTVMTY